MRERLTLGVARRLITDAPWAQERLRPYAGHEIAWDIAGLRGAVVLDDQGLPSALPASAAGADPDAAGLASGHGGARRAGVRVRLEGDDLAALSGGFDALMRRVAIEGNAGLASELAHIGRHLRPEPEEWLVPWLGDALAERAGGGLRTALGWSAQATQRTAQSAAEFIVHEARLVADRAMVAAHCAAVDDTREAADRLAQRIARLESTLSRSPPAQAR